MRTAKLHTAATSGTKVPRRLGPTGIRRRAGTRDGDSALRTGGIFEPVTIAERVEWAKARCVEAGRLLRREPNAVWARVAYTARVHELEDLRSLQRAHERPFLPDAAPMSLLRAAAGEA